MTAVEDLVETAIRTDVPERWRLGRAFVPKTRYVDPEFLRLECERVFPRTWVPGCRLEEIPEAGCYVEVDVAGQSILIVRESSDSVRAFFNSCRHRGTRLARGRGRVGNLRCPFHAWQYGLDGECQYVHDAEDFSDLTSEYLCLRQCKVEHWGGWAFVNLESNAEPLTQFLDPLPERIRILSVEAMRYKWYKTVILPCNWKTALDAFSESYHVPGTHPQLLRSGQHADRPASRRELQSDPSHAPAEVLGRHTARFGVEPRDPAHPRNATKEMLGSIIEYQRRELNAMYGERDLEVARELKASDIPDGPELFAAQRRMVRERALADGLDWPEIPPRVKAEIETNYVVFPNMIFLVRQGGLLGYRSLPNGDDPDSCIFDVYALELFPEGGAPDFAPEFYESWRDGDVREVLTQDFTNVEDVTVGLHSNGFAGATLSTAQEIAVFHRHALLDDYIFGPATSSTS